MCERPACSREHVPPRNLFPEAKDASGRDYRENLITVPSCELHNTAKSRDDEFLMVSLAGIIGNNSIGYRHKMGKVSRAIARSSNHLLECIFIEKKEVFIVELDENKFIEVIWGTPDAKRLVTCFDRVARGLHWQHFGSRFDGAVKIILGYLRPEDKSVANFQRFVEDKATLELNNKQRIGQNPEVFYYQVSDKDQFGLFTMRLCFYGGLCVIAAFIPNGVRLPGNLAIELMNRGIKTIFTLGDKSYEIN